MSTNSSDQATTQSAAGIAGAVSSGIPATAAARRRGPAVAGKEAKGVTAKAAVKAARIPRVQKHAQQLGMPGTAEVQYAATAEGPWYSHSVIATFEGQFARAQAVGKLLQAKGLKLVAGLPLEASPQEMAGYFLGKYLSEIESSIEVLQLAE